MNNRSSPTEQEALSLARRLREKLQSERIPVRDLILFGSIVRGEQHPWSDIDIAILCEPFLPTRHEENMEVRKARRNIDVRISPLCLHPKDFQNRYWRLPKEIARNGVKV